MKTTLLFFLVLLGLSARGQSALYIQGRALTDPDVRHLLIRTQQRDGKLRAFVEIDGIQRNRDDKLTDAAGTVLAFEYLPGLFDHLDRAGWEYLDAIPPGVQFGTNQGILDSSPNATFVFRRKADARSR
jgi:hypothetical protein